MHEADPRQGCSRRHERGSHSIINKASDPDIGIKMPWSELALPAMRRKDVPRPMCWVESILTDIHASKKLHKLDVGPSDPNQMALTDDGRFNLESAEDMILSLQDSQNTLVERGNRLWTDKMGEGESVRTLVHIFHLFLHLSCEEHKLVFIRSLTREIRIFVQFCQGATQTLVNLLDLF